MPAGAVRRHGSGGFLTLVAERDSTALALLAARNLRARQTARVSGTVAFAERYRNFRLKTPWFHKLWYADLDNPATLRALLLAPREHAKTSSVLTWATRRLAENHQLRIGIISGTDPLAIKFLNELKHELTYNEALISDYGHTCDKCGGGPRSFRGERWTDHELVLRDAREGANGIAGKDVSVFAVGRNGQISSRHCDILILDDVETKDSVNTELTRQATREWFGREVISVLSPGGILVVTGTRKHFDDLYGYLLGDTEWTILDQAKSVYKADGTPIWPEMWSAEALLAKKAVMDRVDLLAWPQEMLNTPLPSGTQMFFPDKWPTYYREPEGLTIYQFWDLAISEKTGADYTCGFTVGVDERSNVYLLERRKGHYNFERTLFEIGDMGAKWNATGRLATVGIEQIAYQASAVQEALRRTMLPIIPVVPDKDKVTRARLLEARAAAAKVFRPVNRDDDNNDHDPDWWADFAQEASFFPEGAHDDQIDALAGALRLAGWDGSVVGWAYGVWTCARCAHMFIWAADRPCPKCGAKAPMTFDNPEGGLALN